MLALGLILPIADELDLPSHLIGRPGPESTASYGVSFAPSQPLRFYGLESFTGPERLEQAKPEILQATEDGRPMLITATLRAGIEKRYEFVRELLAGRSSEAETVFFACENSPHPLYTKLREEFEPAGIQFPATVVNRICPKFLEPDEGRRVVRAHECGEWLIARPSQAETIVSLLEGSKFVSFHAPEEIMALEKRKRWIVNGGQLYLAILAHDADEESLVQAANTPGLRDLVNHFHNEAIRVLKAEHPELVENLDYCVKHCVAFCEVADEVPRMVAMQRADLTPFFETFRRRIGEPAALAAETSDGHVPEVFQQVAEAVDSLLEKDRAYDWSDPQNPEQPAVLSAETDARAVKAYAKMLTGWVAAEEIEEKCERLGVILRTHRNYKEPPSRRLKPAN